MGGRCRHGEGGHEGGPDGERVLLALGVDRDDLALADVLGDGAASAREALAHALRAREHWVCRKEVGVSVRGRLGDWGGGRDKQNLMAPRSAWKRGSMKGSVEWNL